MPTNKERREIARKLRETSDAIRYWLDTNPYWYVMKCIYGDVEIHDDNELFYRLADLIEPEPERTCKNESSVSGIFTCSYCGADFYDTEISGDWNYCPNCGAKVVENEVTPTPL